MVHEGVLRADQPVAGLAGRASSSRRPRAARPRTAGRAGRAARRRRGASRGRTSSAWRCRTPDPRVRERVRPANSSISPQVAYVAGTSASLPIRFVTAPTSPTSGSSSGGDQARQPSRRDQRVVVQQHQHVAARERQALVAGPREARVAGVQHQAHVGVGGRELVQVARCAVARAVVDHDQLVAGVLGAGEHALEAMRVNSRLSWVTITMLAAGHGQRMQRGAPAPGGLRSPPTVSCGQARGAARDRA